VEILARYPASLRFAVPLGRREERMRRGRVCAGDVCRLRLASSRRWLSCFGERSFFPWPLFLNLALHLLTVLFLPYKIKGVMRTN